MRELLLLLLSWGKGRDSAEEAKTAFFFASYVL